LGWPLFKKNARPSATITNVIAGLRRVNAPIEGTKRRGIPAVVQGMIISENCQSVFPEWSASPA